ncbi:MAG: hypothetical protein ACJASL_003021 [Paraglaciecola sp.]
MLQVKVKATDVGNRYLIGAFDIIADGNDYAYYAA